MEFQISYVQAPVFSFSGTSGALCSLQNIAGQFVSIDRSSQFYTKSSLEFTPFGLMPGSTYRILNSVYEFGYGLSKPDTITLPFVA